jgi:hypothetical protein
VLSARNRFPEEELAANFEGCPFGQVAALLSFGSLAYIGCMLQRVRNSRGRPLNAPFCDG